MTSAYVYIRQSTSACIIYLIHAILCILKIPPNLIPIAWLLYIVKDTNSYCRHYYNVAMMLIMLIVLIMGLDYHFYCIKAKTFFKG